MANNKALALNDKKIMAMVKPKAKKWVRDGGGLALCLTPTQKGPWRFWYYIYTSPESGKKYYKSLGAYPDMGLASAREEARILAGDVSRKIDPKAQELREMEAKKQVDEERRRFREAEERDLTVSQLVEKYLSQHAKAKKKSWREDERILNKDVVPVWGGRKAKDITRREVLDLIEGMEGRGKGIVTNTFKIIRRMFRFAVKKEYIPATPCCDFEKGEELPRPVSRDRHLSEAEIKTFFAGIDNCAISETIRKVLKLILLTGQRPGEVCSMHSSEIDGRWWEFTPKETKITKEIPRKQRIYLTDAALSLIGPLEVPDAETNEIKPVGYVFKCHTDKGRHVTERAVSAALRRNLESHEVRPRPATWKKVRTKPCRKNPFTIPSEKKLNIEKFTPHDLRRSCATMLSQIGIRDETIDAVLAHLKKGEIKTYNKNRYDDEKREAMQACERKIINIITGEKGKVIPLHRVAAN